MSRRITLVSFYFAPLGRADGVNRAYLSRYLGDLGWDIDVICADHPRGLLRNYQQDTSLLDVLGARVTRHPVPYRFRGGIPELLHLARLQPDPFSHWVPDAVERAVEIAGGIIYAVVPPVSNAAVAVEVARRRRLPLVLDFRDNVWNLPPAWVRSADAILASTDWSLRDMRRHYALDEKVAGLTYFNGFPDESASVADTTREGLIYAGLMNWEQHPFLVAPLLTAARRRAPRLADQLTANFYGPANYYTRLAWRGGIRKVARLRGYVPFSEIRRRFRASQFGLATLVSPSKTYCVPSKVFQYVAAGLPIVAISDEGALAALVREHGIGLHATPAQVETLAPALLDLLENPSHLAATRARVVAASETFSLRRQVATVSQLLDRIGGN